MRYLVDTDWLIDVYIGRPAPARVLEGLRHIGIGVSIVSQHFSRIPNLRLY